MAYRNKTYVAFDSADIRSYRLMTAWKANEHIDFNFYDAHELNTARDTSQPETIKRKLRERLKNAKQVVLLVGDNTRKVAGNASSFLYYEIEVILELQLPAVFVNLNQSRKIERDRLPTKLAGKYYTVTTSFQPQIIKYALDEYVDEFGENLKSKTPKEGPYQYKDFVYKNLGL